MTVDVVVTDTGIDLQPDRARVITQFFAPGSGFHPGCDDSDLSNSRTAPVIERILRLDEHIVEAAALDIENRFSGRHRDLHNILSEHAALVMWGIDPSANLSTARRLVLGASFTYEYAIEGTALCNPSAVIHPEQDTSGDAAFILSVRSIGEGHLSSIGFRTGTLTLDGTVTIDRPGPFPRTAIGAPGLHHQSVFHAKLAELDDDTENAARLLSPLPPRFEDTDLDAYLEMLEASPAARRPAPAVIANLRSLARSSYRIEFPIATSISERVLWPQAPAERHGMEDARFVRFVDVGDEVTYIATYTAFDGINISQQLLATTDFKAFTSSPMAGSAAKGKGLALFPRKIRGQYAALTRCDQETNGIAYSDDLHCWNESDSIQVPERPWEILQLGNCGSPIETKAGWLVLTHGVGPMRTYSIGAMLLDLDEPRRVLARSVEPILSPSNGRRDGYVPNVVYSCGAFAHNDTLVLPYGVADRSISIATLSVEQLIASMR